MSTPAIDAIITDARRLVCESHHCAEPPADSVILSLATQVHLARVALEKVQKRRLKLCERDIPVLDVMGIETRLQGARKFLGQFTDDLDSAEAKLKALLDPHR